MAQDRRHNEDDEPWWAETDRRTIGASLGTVDTFVKRSNRFARNSLYSSSLQRVKVRSPQSIGGRDVDGSGRTREVPAHSLLLVLPTVELMSS